MRRWKILYSAITAALGITATNTTAALAVAIPATSPGIYILIGVLFVATLLCQVAFLDNISPKIMLFILAGNAILMAFGIFDGFQSV